MKVDIDLTVEEIEAEMDRIKTLPVDTRKDEMINSILKMAEDTAQTEVNYALENYEVPDAYIEKLNTEYTVAQFAECTTLSDFQTKLTEIRNRSYNFM